MVKRIGIFLSLLILVLSCKSKAVVAETSVKPMSANKVIKNHYNNRFGKETLSAKMRVKYRGKNELPGVTASLRIKKDEVIWISLSKLGFPVGKAMITQNEVLYYEKINKTYFKGDFALLSTWLGTELDYEKVQNLLLGQAILDLTEQKHDLSSKSAHYELSPKKANEFYSILYLLDPQNFKLLKQQVTQTDDERVLSIDYARYEQIEDEYFPMEVLITAKERRYTTRIDVQYRSVTFNKSLSFPFSIPSGYKEIEL